LPFSVVPVYSPLSLVMRLLTALRAQCFISTLELPRCEMQGQHAESLGGVRVMGQCRELVHLNLSGNVMRAAGAGSLAEVLVQYPAPAHLDLAAM
jgi:hypothetical protein